MGALQRDMKAYISAREYRNIPVGYAAADVAENVDQQLAYFDCGPDGVRGDFFALNDYSWCDPTHSLEPDGTRRLSDTLAMAFQFSWPNSAASPTDETGTKSPPSTPPTAKSPPTPISPVLRLRTRRPPTQAAMEDIPLRPPHSSARLPATTGRSLTT